MGKCLSDSFEGLELPQFSISLKKKKQKKYIAAQTLHFLLQTLTLKTMFPVVTREETAPVVEMNSFSLSTPDSSYPPLLANKYK